VQANYCTTNLYGVLATGTNTAGSLAGIARGGTISGNTIIMINGGGGVAGIWLNGLASGAGAANITVSNNYLSGDGATDFTCMKVSGQSTDNVFVSNTCRNSSSNSIGASSSSGLDAGGLPSNSIFADNVFDNIKVQSGNVAVIQLLGTSDLAHGNRTFGGNYPYVFWMTGTNDVAIWNVSVAGSSGTFDTSGATNPIVADVVDGLSCTGTPSSSFASVNGIVTHC
jgi:hypothetical protein